MKDNREKRVNIQQNMLKLKPDNKKKKQRQDDMGNLFVCIF